MRIIMIFAGLAFAALVLLLAWLLNRLMKTGKSLWERVWQLEVFLITFIGAALISGFILETIRYFMSLLSDNSTCNIPSIIPGCVIMVVSSLISILILMATLSFIDWLRGKGHLKEEDWGLNP